MTSTGGTGEGSAADAEVSSHHTSEEIQGKRPEWAPAEAGSEFASRVHPGRMSVTVNNSAPRRRALPSVPDLEAGIRAGDRALLARAVTIIESNAPKHRAMAEDLIQRLIDATGKSVRIGITGVPGAGKSTFIEAFGQYVIGQGHKVAVLAVDPSSSLTGGSILGDKVRMERLSREENAFIRPSPSGGMLGGVTRKSRETLLLCEAAGYDVILVETVGVGQSETAIRGMVDFFLLILLTGAGDELQGMKKGIMELADGLWINKADGENMTRALAFKTEMNRVLHFLRSPSEGWKPKAHTVSALTGEGIERVWEIISDFQKVTQNSGVFQQRRQRQNVDWMHALIGEALRDRFYRNDAVRAQLDEMENAVAAGDIPATAAASQLLELA